MNANANGLFRSVQVAAVYMYMLYVAFPMLKIMQQQFTQPFACQHALLLMLLCGPRLELSCLLGCIKALHSPAPLPFPIAY